MTKFSQRATSIVAVLLLGVGMFWWLERREPSIAATFSPTTHQKPFGVDRPSGLSRTMLSAQTALGQTEFREIEDRFANCPVIEQRQDSRREKGVTKISRVRLVRKDDFKYPVVRVSDELVAQPQGERLLRQTAMVGDHVLVKLTNPNLSEAAFLAQLKDAGASIRRKMPASGTWLIAFAEPTVDTVPKAVVRLSALKPLVRYAEPDYIVHATAQPNDSSYVELWGLHNSGQNGGIHDVDIDAPEAWDLQTGNSAVVVAILDSGLDRNHPDLMDNLWTNPGEIPANGLDDDSNGYIDDFRGWDFVNNDNNASDDNSHGTHCAGTIGAAGNNAIGVSGVCWDVSMVGLKFLDASGNGSHSDGIEAISYATNAGVTLTSNSWGGGAFSQAMKDAIDEANEAGILFVAASGNDGTNMEFSPGYPASYTSGNIISVAAITRQDALADYSNFGETTTDLGAPGSEIYSTIPGGGYGIKSGTSMAAPHVAGACALLKAHRPNLTHSQIKEILLRSVDTTAALAGKTVTGGRLNLYSALLATDDILATPGTSFSAVGPVGGPFTPAAMVYTLTNHRTEDAEWTASVNRAWVTLSAGSGTLAAEESIQIQVTLNAETDHLLAGDNTATITFTSLATGRTQLRQVNLRASPPPLYSFNLDTDPGWERTGAWEYGIPSGQGGIMYGQSDPYSGATGDHVFGVNLNGDYPAEAGPAQYLIAGPFDLSSHHGSALRFQRWLNTDFQSWVYATIEVSHDQIIWYPVWDNGMSMLVTADWTQVEYDLSQYADGHSQVYVRWGHEVRDGDAYPLSGWNVDDVEILAVPDRQIRLTLPLAVTEAGAPALAKVTAAPVSDLDLVVSLSSDHPGAEISFPATVTIPAGQEEATFSVTPLDDTRVDGSQPTTLTVSAVSYPSHSASILTHDNEAGSLALTLPESLNEGVATQFPFGEVSLPSPAVADIVIHLASMDITEVSVPATVTILAGETSAFFALSTADDDFIDGTQVAGITASVTNWPTATASIQVLDDEPRLLFVTLPEPQMETAGTLGTGGIVSLPFPVETDLIVNLQSGDSSELVVPAQVTVPARTSSVTFSLALQDDLLADGPQTVQVTATAPNFVTGNATLIVNDDETPAFPSNPIPANGATSLHPETDLAWQIEPGSGGAPDDYEVYFGINPAPSAAESIGLTNTMSRVLPRLTPGATYYWRIVARKGAATRAGPVWSFTVAPVGPLKRFAWDPLPSGIYVAAPFPARVTAYDDYDNPVTSFAGNVALSTIGGGPETTTGTGSILWEFPFATYFHDARTQSIYLPSEIGPAGSLTSMALDLTVLPVQPLTNFTIRVKHTTKALYAPSGQQNWENTGWTTVYRSTTTLTTTGWNWFVFTTPFAYDGASNLMVDISFNNNFYTTYGRSKASPTSTYRSLYHLTDSNYGDPTTWVNTLPFGAMSYSLPNLKFRRSEFSVPISPATIGPFSNGTWSGNLTLSQPGDSLYILAKLTTNNTIQGLSDSFNVTAAPIFSLSDEPLFTGGTTNTLSWASLGAGFDYEIERATNSGFSAPVSSGFISGTEHTFTALADGQTYHYRGRARANGVTGPWSMPVRSTQDATPPSITLTPATGGVIVANSLTLSGTGADQTSGIATLSVNDLTAVTTNGFAEWHWDVTSLPDGLTTLAITVRDQAVPPNTRTESWTITRISDVTADSDHNGVGTLLEYAFNTSGLSAPSALPQVTASIDPATQENYLTLSYRRRLNASGLSYVIETSSNLVDWQPAGASAETLSVTPIGDEMTEMVRVSVRPPSGHIRSFVRVRVAVP